MRRVFFRNQMLRLVHPCSIFRSTGRFSRRSSGLTYPQLGLIWSRTDLLPPCSLCLTWRWLLCNFLPDFQSKRRLTSPTSRLRSAKYNNVFQLFRYLVIFRRLTRGKLQTVLSQQLYFADIFIKN